jgi:hypothetical protein
MDIPFSGHKATVYHMLQYVFAKYTSHCWDQEEMHASHLPRVEDSLAEEWGTSYSVASTPSRRWTSCDECLL